MNVVDRVADDLFAADMKRVENVKFCRGTCTSVTAKQLAEQLELATAEICGNVAIRVQDIDSFWPNQARKAGNA